MVNLRANDNSGGVSEIALPTAPAHTKTAPDPAATTIPVVLLPADDKIAVDAEYLDSAYGIDDSASETTSLASSLNKGYIENGRRYQTIKADGDTYYAPSDDQQFESMEAGHLLYRILDSQEENPLFRSPVPKYAQHIIDIGTGDGTWAIEVADSYPEVTVNGVDLYPPPATWVPPNCIFEVDDITQDWTWQNKFDLIHMRNLLGAFTPEEWTNLYSRCYDALVPGGWIEEVELDVRVMSDDGSLSEDSYLHGWGPKFLACAERAGRPLDTHTTMRSKIAEAGFTEIHEKLYKCPIGSWPRHPVYKEAGLINKEHWSSGLEGWAMWLLTKYGEPEPWNADEVRVYVEKVRKEMADKGLHIYHYTRRVWARKPL